MSQSPSLMPVEEEDLTIHLHVADRGDHFEIQRMSIDTKTEPSMSEVAAIFEYMADALRRGNYESLGMNH